MRALDQCPLAAGSFAGNRQISRYCQCHEKLHVKTIAGKQQAASACLERYNGAALVILKTDGPKEDAVTQWKLELSPDKHTLNVEYTHIDPADKTANLLFGKKSI
jgi:hypothetical protein